MKMKTLAVLTFLLIAAISLFAQGPTGRTVTQATSITTGVTINSDAGVITTVSATTAALGKSTFTVTNSSVEAGSIVIPAIVNYAGTYTTNGTPVVTVNNITAGAFDVNLLNVHTTNALSGVVKIAFFVRN